MVSEKTKMEKYFETRMKKIYEGIDSCERQIFATEKEMRETRHAEWKASMEKVRDFFLTQLNILHFNRTMILKDMAREVGMEKARALLTRMEKELRQKQAKAFKDPAELKEFIRSRQARKKRALKSPQTKARPQQNNPRKTKQARARHPKR